ncbi:ZIP family metal transporter [Novosphingobium sp. 1949]|uniref:ZIP family metal transporter n=1 Tax=Novosphingobium organovorum TaxID=2930092 RepID=A0ABT0BAZ7_9SPHN|nr:ZIP family metal transporter [Novosphingobium organovorum]MCJ2181996.1 ZIP family metal transporter [Novosphingobium organovorum]
MHTMIASDAFPLALIALGTALSSWLGGLFTMRLFARSTLLFALTGGLALGVAVFDLLPEALEGRSGAFQILLVFALVLLGLGASLLFHHLPEGSLAKAGPGRIALLLHSLIDGLGIGLAFQVSAQTGWIIAAAVLAHDMADGANMAGLSLARADRRSAYRWVLANALAPALGIAVGQLLPIEPAHFGWLLAFFAGGFLYIALFELLPQSLTGHGRARSLIGTALGMAAMGGIVSLAHG